MTTADWTRIGHVDDIPKQGARVVYAGDMKIAVFRTADGDIYAIEDKCPHLGGPLSQGIVHGSQVTCPLHNLVIDLKSGGAMGPDEGCVRTIPVRVTDGIVALDTSALIASDAQATALKRNSDPKAA